MSDVSNVRKEILDEIFKASQAKKISWTFEESDNSAQAFLTDFQVHFDQKSGVGGLYYKVWILDNEADLIDEYLVRESTTGTPAADSYSSYFEGVDNIHKSAKEQKKLDELNPILEKLRRLT